MKKQKMKITVDARSARSARSVAGGNFDMASVLKKLYAAVRTVRDMRNNAPKSPPFAPPWWTMRLLYQHDTERRTEGLFARLLRRYSFLSPERASIAFGLSAALPPLPMLAGWADAQTHFGTEVHRYE